MQDIVDRSLKWLRRTRVRRMRMVAILLVLSLVVSLDVFWILRQPGLTLAGNADCKIVEHTHNAICQSGDVPCNLTEHVHTLECYSNESLDVEAQLDWQKMFADYPMTGNLRTDLVNIAKTQVGYTESKQNYQVADDGVTRGYTRYGAWYGAPYNDWSALFVSFCLHYAGADSKQYPGNIGANAMAELWKKANKYAPVGQYTPVSGDLVFFKDNTVGIVTEVLNATVYVIRGDVEGAVRGSVLFQSDASISGWGLIDGTPTPTDKHPTVEETDPLDISNGPVVYFYENHNGETPKRARYLYQRNATTITDLIPYLNENGGNFFFTLLDLNNVELPKDENGNYIATAGVGYKLTLTFVSPEGFLPGTYQYQIPNGLMVDGGEGSFVLKDGTEVGSWVVTDTGLITLEFNDHMNSRTDITISSTLGIHFPEQEEPIDFDGKITVTIEKSPPQTNPTYVNKWGKQGGTQGAELIDPGKIYWGLEIIGNKDSQIPGNILTDRIVFGEWSKTHKFTESDMAGGLTFGVASPNGGWHAWTVHTDDPHLIWTETGWSYKMPTTATCQWCGEIELGNEGWYYYINYTSTPDRAGTAGTFGYENDATIDGAYGYAWVNFTHGDITGEIIKNGSFISDAGGAAFLWEFQAIIPGRAVGQKADYHWYIMDNMSLLNSNGSFISRFENSAHLATVYATFNGTTIQIPRIQDATDNDLFAWDNAWTATENGINYGREFNLLHRCQCTPETCFWGNHCDEYWFQQDDGTHLQNGFCQCWTPTEEIVFTFVYKTNDLSLVERYGGLNYQLYNEANLYYKPDGISAALVSGSTAQVPIPGLFHKELTHDFDGYTANYRITINEAKLVLTDGSPLHIRDSMTDTLAFISGSLVITAEDVNGNVTTLRQGADYTVTYDGTGNQKDDQGKQVHVLDILILHPQPVMYTLDYDTTLIFPDQVTGAIKYSNSAEITLWGESIKDNAVEKVYADINISAKSYTVKLMKTSAETGEPLADAMFGLYNEHGGLIATATTNIHGELAFQSNIAQGIILREHVLYYVQELRAPPGYKLDDTKHWLCFCNEIGNSCGVYKEIAPGVDVIRIPLEQGGNIPVTNNLMPYALPETGGFGIYPLILVSVIFIITPLVYMSIQKRKRERRGVG